MFSSFNNWIAKWRRALMGGVALVAAWFVYQHYGQALLMWLVPGTVFLLVKFQSIVTFSHHMISLCEKLLKGCKWAMDGADEAGDTLPNSNDGVTHEQSATPARAVTRTGTSPWLIALLATAYVLFAPETTSHDEHRADQASIVITDPDLASPGWADKDWKFAEAIQSQGFTNFGRDTSFFKPVNFGSPVKIEGMANGPVRMRLIDETANPAYGIVECSEHGHPIGFATIVCVSTNRIELTVFIHGDRDHPARLLQSVFCCGEHATDRLIATD